MSLPLQEMKKALEERAELPNTSAVSDIALPWMMDIVGDLKRYREAFLIDYMKDLSPEER